MRHGQPPAALGPPAGQHRGSGEVVDPASAGRLALRGAQQRYDVIGDFPSARSCSFGAGDTFVKDSPSSTGGPRPTYDTVGGLIAATSRGGLRSPAADGLAR